MRTYFLILALALLKVSMARPSGDDDFSIDMYQGDNHLRYERSNDAPTSEEGTTVIENIDADSELHETEQTEHFEEPLSVQESIQRLADVSTEWEAKTSEEQKNEVEAHNVFQETVTTKDSSVESAATVKKEETPAVAAATAEVKEKKVEKAKEAAETSAHMSSKSTTKTEISTGSERRGGQPKEEAVELSRPRYLFQYGDVLNRINQDKVSPLAASKSQSKSAKSKKLSKAAAPTKSVSYMMVNGKEYSGVSPNNMFLAKPQENAFNGPAAAAPYGGPRAFGGAAPVLPPGFNYAGFAPPSAQFAPAPVHGFGETHNLKSNLKMGFRGFGGQQRGGVQMLNFRQQPAAPFQAAPRFRPF